MIVSFKAFIFGALIFVGTNPAFASNDQDMKRFVSTILGSLEETWEDIFEIYSKKYPKPDLVIYSGQTKTACGSLDAKNEPHYCPADEKIYIDPGYFYRLATEFGADGDFAQAYIIAHQVGHHVQNVIGVLPHFNRMKRSMGKLEANRMSVKVELQADCFAGIWAYYFARQGLLGAADLEEALVVVRVLGDDTVQRRTQGYVNPESFTNGTSEQRKRWFMRGFESGRIEACNTFEGKS